MCNRYWDLYECRWQDYSRPEAGLAGQLHDTLVPEPRAEVLPDMPMAAPSPPAPQEAGAAVSAPVLSVG